MKRTAATAFSSTSTSTSTSIPTRIRCQAIVPDLPPEIWDLILFFSRPSHSSMLRLSETSKTLRTLYFALIDTAYVCKRRVHGAYEGASRFSFPLGERSGFSFSNLTNIVRLGLEWMPHDANLSEYLSGLSNLRRLDCSKWAGLAPGSLPNPSKLVRLKLETESVDDAERRRICDGDILQFTNLSTLKIYKGGENFTGSCLSVLTNIERLVLAETKCASTPEFTNLEKLSRLTIRSCPFEFANGLLTLDNLSTSLVELELWGNLRDKEALRLNSLTNLTTLTLVGCNVPYENMSRLARLRNLKLSGEEFNGFLDSAEDDVSGFVELRRLKLSTARRVNLSGLTGLTKLQLSSGAGIKKGCARDLSDLRSLKCRYACLNDLNDEGLAEMTSLRSLYVCMSGSLTNASVSQLTDLTKLRVKGAVRITEECLSALPKLKRWKFNGNGIRNATKGWEVRTV